MSLNTEFGITLRTKGIDEALKKLNALGKQADKATSAGQRMEKMWSGLSTVGVRFEKNWGNLSSMMAGLETQIGRVAGASNNAMRQQQNVYQNARMEMVKLASAQKTIVGGFGNIERKGRESGAEIKRWMVSTKSIERQEKKRLEEYKNAHAKRVLEKPDKQFKYWSKTVNKRTITRNERFYDLAINLVDDLPGLALALGKMDIKGIATSVASMGADAAKHAYKYEIPEKHWNNTSLGLKQDAEKLKWEAKYIGKRGKYLDALIAESNKFDVAVNPTVSDANKLKALNDIAYTNKDVISDIGDIAGSIKEVKKWFAKEEKVVRKDISISKDKFNDKFALHLANVDSYKELTKEELVRNDYVGMSTRHYSAGAQQQYVDDWRSYPRHGLKVNNRKIGINSNEAMRYVEMTGDVKYVFDRTEEIYQIAGDGASPESKKYFDGIKNNMGKWVEMSFGWGGLIKNEDKIGFLELFNTAHEDLEYANNEFDESLTERTNMMEQAAQEQVQITQDGTTQIQDSWKQVFDENEFGFKDPLQGFQEEVSNLSFDLEGIGDAAQTSSKDIVKANKEAQKSQIDLSKAITLETKDAIDESRDYQFKYYNGLYGETQDYFDFSIDLAEQETQIVEDQTGEQTRIVQQATQEQARIQESGTVSMLKSWSDMTQGWDQIAMNALDGLQQTLYQTFHSAFSGVGDAWDNLWDGMKNIAYQVLASIATKMAKGLVGNIVMNFIPGSSGGGGNLFGGSGNMFGNGMDYGQMSNFMGYGPTWFNDMTSGFTGATNYGAIQGDWAGINMDIGGATGTAGSAAGTAGNWGAFSQGGMASAGAVAGAAISAYSLYQLYENGPGGAEGAMQGMMTGAMGGAGFGPWGVVIGAAIGALAGGLGGGGNDDVDDRIADAQRFGKIAKELTRQSNLDEDVDVDKYLEAINAAHRSDNRVDSEAMWTLYSNLKSKGDLPWWAGDPGQIAHIQGLQGTEWGQPDWMRYRLFGKGGLPDETGDSGMAQWFGGEGEGPWGSDGGWDKVKGALDEMDNETLDRLGEALFNVKEGAAAFGIDMAELMGTFDMAQLESGEWATILKDELTPASLMAAMNDQLRAEGMTNLEIASQKQAAAIDSLLGTFNMSEEDTDSWIDQLFQANATQADLSAKMEEYQKIVEELETVKAGEEEKTKDLIERGRALREELGLGESAFSKIEEGFETFVTAMEDIAKRLIDAANGDREESHHGGLIYHSGGMVGAMLRAGLITPHGGMTSMHTGGLRPDERMAILQAGEYVIQRSSVNPATLAALRSINATGRLPMEQISQAMRQASNTPKFHTGGYVNTAPALASSPQPQGGDSGRPVTINFSPQISVNAENGADAAKIEAAVTKALEKSRVALKRQLEQTGYQVVDAQ